ncbi:MAG TPA: DUF421 domain-containing protein [Clostridia bacterium]|nr:DUF421 domain-containing protein [Clostridia bacterium]
MSDIIKVLIFSVAAYVYLFVIAKLLGKKQIAQLTFLDYVVGISIGSIAAEMATETDQPFYHFLIAMAVFFLFDFIVSFISRKSLVLKKWINGKPLVIINDGKIDYQTLKQSKLTVDELCGLAREKNFFDIKDIAYAVFETNGELTVLPKSNKQPVVSENINIILPDPELTQFMILDGQVCEEILHSQNRSRKWLFDKLKIKNKNDLKSVLIAEYDEKTDTFFTQYKNEKEYES